MIDYTAKDLNPMSWQEFGAIFQRLIAEIDAFSQRRGIKFDAVAPILRSGGIPGSAMAIQLDIPKMIPLQYRYRYNPTRVESVQVIMEALQGLSQTTHVLICETNTSHGATAELAIRQLREHIPGSKLYYATVALVYGAPESFAGVEQVFWGVRTNERKVACPTEAQTLGLRDGICLFPWERAELELREMNQGE
jgi:hypothetical protein